MNKYFRLFGYCAVALMAVACSDDEPGDGGNGDNTEAATVGNVFGPEGYVSNFDGNELTITDGRVTRVTGNSGYATLEYDLPKIVMRTYNGSRSGESYIYNLTCNKEGFVTHVEMMEYDELHHTYDITYNADGYMTKFVQHFDPKNSADDETTTLTWSGGNITKVNCKWAGGSSETVFKYTDIDNVAGIMLYDTQLWVDADGWGDILYYCGLLGRPTKKLVGSSVTKENDGGIWTFEFSSNYSLDSNNRPTCVIVTEEEIDPNGTSQGKYVSQIDFGWKNW